MNLGCSWSGGKDSCFALMKQLASGKDQLKVIMNVMDENMTYSRSHGLKKAVLKAQASALGVPIHFAAATWVDYEINYIKNLYRLSDDYQLDAMVYGDIDIIQHREWEEKVSSAAGIKAMLPIWQGNRRQLITDMVNSGIKAIIASCNLALGLDYLGREITIDLIEELESKGIDACGENGEFHTLVYDCPLFSKPIEFQLGQKISTENYCFVEIELDTHYSEEVS